MKEKIKTKLKITLNKLHIKYVKAKMFIVRMVIRLIFGKDALTWTDKMLDIQEKDNDNLIL